MKYFTRNSPEAQKILFNYGYHWSEYSREVNHLEYPVITFMVDNTNFSLYHSEINSVRLMSYGYVFIRSDQIRDVIKRLFEQIIYDVDIFNNIPDGITKFTYKGINYELKEVTETKWVIV
jgi:hypothetical protein